MEPTALAIAIATIFFSEALKEGGKALGKGVSEAFTKLTSIVQKKFQAEGTAGLLARAEKQPTQSNIELVQAELVTQIQEDALYTDQLRELLTQLESDQIIRQVMASNLEVKGNLEATSMSQTATPGLNATQEMLTNVKAENINLGNLSQQG